MALPTRPSSSWIQGLDIPSRVFGNDLFGDGDYELTETEDAFVLTIDMPGFETDEISLAWDDGVLNVAAEHVDEARDRTKRYQRRFRVPADIDEDGITAEYRNGVLEVTMPTFEESRIQGQPIPIEG